MIAASPPPQRPPITPVSDDHLPEPDAAATEAADETEMPLPSDPRTFFLGGLFGLGALAALYVASAIILPIVLAFVLNLLLQPAVRLLGCLHLPRTVGALLTIFLVIGALAGLVAALSVPTATWAERLPEGIPRLQAHLQVIRVPIEALQKVIQQAEQVADAPPGQGSIVSVRRDLGLTGALFAGTRSVLDGLFTTVLVLYFLLVAGDIFLRRIVEILPTFGDKRQAVDISQQIQEDISGYLVTITAMNAAVGVTTAAAMYLCGLGDPLLWGTTAFLLNYIPILGPLFGVGIFVLVGMLSFESLWWALLPPALYLGIHLIEGETVTPMLLARRFTLNPVLIILSLIFWFWMWGVLGAILAVPMLAILKIICDRLRPLKALGHFLEGE
ncbi:AI-2E family transporter [Bradyrhizobium sp. CCBAU 051011]|uniref:AI-2E family transporter n=1 Tax=Bradyrhizobium sp. CCBAU 051011 TaxID=858422 RepID=UPI0013744F23|nr:AI-2E family transporter [Bradyrhizobium sp. CCBAU 051011]QHO75484.1 AI-2E family transporter [Bradyrhizobium sp. CCBAU 051011]